MVENVSSSLKCRYFYVVVTVCANYDFSQAVGTVTMAWHYLVVTVKLLNCSLLVLIVNVNRLSNINFRRLSSILKMCVWHSLLFSLYIIVIPI